jgi:hypothetical protein
MRKEISWLGSHLHDESGVGRSQQPPEQLLRRICTRLSVRRGAAGFVADERFGSYLADFKDRGDDAIESRGLWGRVNGCRFELAAASGYRAHRWWVPKLTGSIESFGQGSIIKYRLRAIQRRHLLIIGIQLLFGILFISVGVGLLFDANIGGALVLAFGIIAIGAIFVFARIAAPIAMGMERYLKQNIADLLE